jgi:hypothetical protein
MLSMPRGISLGLVIKNMFGNVKTVKTQEKGSLTHPGSAISSEIRSQMFPAIGSSDHGCSGLGKVGGFGGGFPVDLLPML